MTTATEIKIEDNPFQAVARYKKCRAAAEALHSLGVLRVSREAPGELRVWAASVAGTHPLSDTSWALMCFMLEEMSE